MLTLLSEFSINICSVVFLIENLLFHVGGRADESVTTHPITHAIQLLIDNLIVGIQSTSLLIFALRLEELTRHHLLELLTFEIFLLDYPVSPLATVIRVSHQGIRAPSTLIKSIVGEAWITFTEGCRTFLITCAMTITIN